MRRLRIDEVHMFKCGIGQDLRIGRHRTTYASSIIYEVRSDDTVGLGEGSCSKKRMLKYTGI